VDYWSANPKELGCGIRVWPGGTKAWFQYTRQTGDGHARRITLGTFPDRKLPMARTLAADARAKVKVQQYSADERRAEREAQRNTVAALFKAYAEHAGVRHEAEEYRSRPTTCGAL
jgi:hypothetical protein